MKTIRTIFFKNCKFFLLLIVLLIFLLGCETQINEVNGKAPTYQGMSMSNTALVNKEYNEHSILLDVNEYKNMISSYFEYDTTNNLDYYFEKDTEAFLRIELSNPDGQAILRFTLNNIIYQSFQFYEGSNSENIILAVNIEDQAGIFEYTIDEIKYVENGTNQIKDVIFDGNRTIKVGVAYSTLPKSVLNDSTINSTNLNLSVDIIDEENIMNLSQNGVKIFLIKDNQIIYVQDLEKGINSFTYKQLLPSENYSIIIATVLDLLDGSGEYIYFLDDVLPIRTNDIVKISNILPTHNSVNFNIEMFDDDNVGRISSIDIYQDDVLIESLEDLSRRAFTNLLSNNTYTLRIFYEYNLDNQDISNVIFYDYEFNTKQLVIPSIDLVPISIHDNVVELDLVIDDPDSVIISYDVSLLNENIIIDSSANMQKAYLNYTEFDSNFELALKYTYNLNDGNDLIEMVQIIETSEIVFNYSLDTNDLNYEFSYTSNLLLPTPERVGYTFIGWYLENTYENKVTSTNDLPLKNIMLYSKWETNIHTIEVYAHEVNTDKWILLEAGEEIEKVSSMSRSSAILTNKGRVFVWGKNNYGQLGIGNTIDQDYPIEITNNFNLSENEKVIDIQFGNSYAIALTNLNNVYSWGWNIYGMLADGTLDNELLPQDVTSNFQLDVDESIIQLNVYSIYSGVLTDKGRLLLWGINLNNMFGQTYDPEVILNIPTDFTFLFDLNIDEKLTYIEIGHSYYALTNQNRLFKWGKEHLSIGAYNLAEPVLIHDQFSLSEGENIIKIENVNDHTVFLTNSGRLFVEGYNSSDSLTSYVNQYTNGIIEITSYIPLEDTEYIKDVYTSLSTIVVTNENRIITFGNNGYGTIGNGNFTDVGIPYELPYVFGSIKDISLSSNVMILHNGFITVWGSNDNNQILADINGNLSTPTEVFVFNQSIEKVSLDLYYNDIINLDNLSFEGYSIEGIYVDSMFSIIFDETVMPDQDIILYVKLIKE